MGLLLQSCATAPSMLGYCEAGGFLIDNQFEGGNFATCNVVNDNTANLLVRPEDKPPINQSPWYAFRVSPKSADPVCVSVQFEDGYARYWPKLSTDGVNWRRARDDEASIAADGNTLTVGANSASTFVSTQELIINPFATQARVAGRNRNFRPEGEGRRPHICAGPRDFSAFPHGHQIGSTICVNRRDCDLGAGLLNVLLY